MKRGVVVELDDDFVTLLTPDGQFLRTLNKEGKYELGEEISFFPLADKREEAATRTKRAGNRILFNLRTRTARIGALSAVAIIFFMISFLPFFNNDKVYAYMSIDINPSFEVSLDNHLKVISLVPLNDEATNILDSLVDWQEKSLNEIVEIIINECKSDGYVYPGKEIVITTVMNETDKKIEQQLQENLTKISSTVEEEEMIVKTINSDTETREKAQKQGVSTGKYIELVEQQEESDSTQSDVIPAPIVPEKKETNTHTPSQVKEQSNTKPADNNSVQRELKSETKEKLDKTKQKIKENVKKNQQKNNENKQNNNKQTVRVKQEERKENRNERNREWYDKKDFDHDNDRNDDDHDKDEWHKDRDDDKNEHKGYNREKNNNGWQNKEDRKQQKNDRNRDRDDD